MTTTLLRTKLGAPAPRPQLVHHHRLIAMLDAGVKTKLTLVSAPATLIGKRIPKSENPAARNMAGLVDLRLEGIGRLVKARTEQEMVYQAQLGFAANRQEEAKH